MKIHRIKIENFNSIVDPIKINQFSNLNILVGPNNAGKTNILNACEAVFKKNINKKKAKINLQIKDEGKLVDISYVEGRIEHQLSPENYEKIKSKVIRVGKEIPFLKIATEKLENFKKNHPDNYKEFTSNLKKNFRNVRISEEIFKSDITNSEKSKAFVRMGDGFKRLFVILFYFYNPEYEIILIDEPELHLHPSVIKKFLKILNTTDQKAQIIMTTHHPSFVQANLLDKIWRVIRDENQSTIVSGFSKKDGFKPERFIQEINDDNSEMLFTDKALLVEGVSDCILMRLLIDKFYKGNKDIKVVYSGGVGDITLYETICEIFKIPYTVMIDEDALESYWKKKVSDQNNPNLTKRDILKTKGVYVLKGDLEGSYPKKYQIKETKPLSALFAGTKITEEEFQSEEMKCLREIIENL